MCLLPFKTYEFDYQNNTRCKRIMDSDRFQKMKEISENREPLSLEYMEASKLLTYQWAHYANEFLNKYPNTSTINSQFFQMKGINEGCMEMKDVDAREPVENEEWVRVFETVINNDTLYRTVVGNMFPIQGELKHCYQKGFKEPILFSCGLGYITVFEPIQIQRHNIFEDIITKERHDALVKKIKDSVALDEKTRKRVAETAGNESFLCCVAGLCLNLFENDDDLMPTQIYTK